MKVPPWNTVCVCVCVGGVGGILYDGPDLNTIH